MINGYNKTLYEKATYCLPLRTCLSALAYIFAIGYWAYQEGYIQYIHAQAAI